MYMVTNISNGVHIAGPFSYHDEAEDFIRKNKYPFNWSVTSGDVGYSYSSSLVKEKNVEAERKREQEQRDFEDKWKRNALISQRGIIM